METVYKKEPWEIRKNKIDNALRELEKAYRYVEKNATEDILTHAKDEKVDELVSEIKAVAKNIVESTDKVIAPYFVNLGEYFKQKL